MQTPAPLLSPALPPARAFSRGPLLSLACLVALLVVLYHAASGSARSELGAHPDEAAHFVTGLMVRDYLASGLRQSPLAYADAYYRHYPKIGLGVWPPFFYLVQAAWMLVFPVGTQSALWLMAGLAAGLGTLVAWALLREFGWVAAAAGSVLLVSLPLFQQYSNMVMAEMLSALLMFGATLCFARFIETGGAREAVGFGILAGLAIMTKGTGLALVFVPVLGIAFTGRFDLLKNRRLWMAALIVLLIAGPWTWHFRNQGRGGWEEPSPSVRFTRVAILFYGRQLTVAGGWLLTAPALAGALTLITPGGRKSALTATAAALIMGVWVFQSLTPVGLEARHLLPAMPALVFLAMAGLRRIASGWPPRQCATYGLVLVLFFGLPLLQAQPEPGPGYGSLGNAIALSPFRVPRKEWHGFEALADAAAAAHYQRLLVASDARGEGIFIAEMALRDPHRPGWTVERASKSLASSTWSGGAYQPFYTTPEQVGAALAQSGVQGVVIDSSPAAIPPHEQLLQKALSNAGGPYRLIRRAPATRDGADHPGALGFYRAVP